jgi:hypothetical protein
MSNRNRTTKKDTPLNPADVPLEDKQRQLEGRQADDKQSAFVDRSEADQLSEYTETDHYEAEAEARDAADFTNPEERLDLLEEREVRAGETDDAFKAAEEGMTYIPPVDPPIVRSEGYEDAQVGSGMGVSAFGEVYNRDHHNIDLPGADEVKERVYEALHADSATHRLADQIIVLVRGDTVILRGMVADIDDSNNAAAAARYVEGVAEVIDELDVHTMQK